jgi:hypothetical protein
LRYTVSTKKLERFGKLCNWRRAEAREATKSGKGKGFERFEKFLENFEN